VISGVALTDASPTITEIVAVVAGLRAEWSHLQLGQSADRGARIYWLGICADWREQTRRKN
jgi:hypothetical protein